jgi:hypothetical protein
LVSHPYFKEDIGLEGLGGLEGLEHKSDFLYDNAAGINPRPTIVVKIQAAVFAADLRG